MYFVYSDLRRYSSHMTTIINENKPNVLLLGHPRRGGLYRSARLWVCCLSVVCLSVVVIV